MNMENEKISLVAEIVKQIIDLPYEDQVIAFKEIQKGVLDWRRGVIEQKHCLIKSEDDLINKISTGNNAIQNNDAVKPVSMSGY